MHCASMQRTPTPDHYRVSVHSERHIARVYPTHRTRRHGRLLVECLVAMVLLAVAGLALTAGTGSLTALSDDAILVARARSSAAENVELSLAFACDSVVRTPTAAPFGARITTSAADTRSPGLVVRTVNIAFQPSPLTQRVQQRLVTSVGKYCE